MLTFVVLGYVIIIEDQRKYHLTLFVFPLILIHTVYQVAASGLSEPLVAGLINLCQHTIEVTSIFVLIRSEKELKYILFIVPIIVVVTLLISFGEIVTGSHLTASRLSKPGFSETGGVSALWYNRNDFGLFLSLSFPIVLLYHSISTNKWKRYSMLVLVGTIFAILIYNGSRAAFLASVVTALLYMFANQSGIRTILQSHYMRFGTMGSFGLASIMAIMPQFLENPFPEGASLWIRWQLLSTVPELVVNWPVGVGVSNFPFAVSRLAVDTNEILSPHNWMLELVGELGIFGLLIFIFIFGRRVDILTISWLRTSDPLPLTLCLSLVAFLIAGLGPSSSLWGRHTIWIIFGFVITYENFRP